MAKAYSRIHFRCAIGCALVVAACSSNHATTSLPDAQGATGDGGVTGEGGVKGDGGVAGEGGLVSVAQTFPLEVLGPNGTTVTVPLPSLSTAQINAVSALRLQVHALNYPGKATVQVNSGTPMVLANPSAVAANDDDNSAPGEAGARVGANALLNPDVTIDEPGWSYGGIGGAFATLWLSVTLRGGALHEGTGNTVSFTFNQTSGYEGGSIGYRVLFLNLADSTGKLLLVPAPNSPNFLPENDPSSWTAPLTDPSDVAAGQNLWMGTANPPQPLQASPLNNTHILQAACTDCHTRDGRDLQYFGFSNRSIIERAKFHGMTTKQGEQVASFIRNVATHGPVVGRPWNPPFQPGPGLDANAASQWAAGASINAAVANDVLTVTDLFPFDGGIADASADAVDKVAQSDKAVNLRQVRVALQLPDWNHWLPTTHPLDVSTSFASQFTATNGAQSAYESIRNHFTGADASDAAAAAYTTDLLPNESRTLYQQDLQTMRTAAAALKSFFTAADAGALSPSDAATDARYSLALWDLVKQFELFLQFDQAELGPKVFGAKAEARSWPTLTAGDASPHQNGNRAGSPYPTLRTNLRAQYLGAAWDYVQIIVNPGDRVVERTIPWEYVGGEIVTLNRVYTNTQGTQGEGLRAVAVALKTMTEHNTGSLATIGSVNATNCPDSGTTCWAAHDDYPLDLVAFPAVTQNLGAQAPAALSAVIRAWLAVMQRSTYSPANWWLTYYTQDVETCDATPDGGCSVLCEYDSQIDMVADSTNSNNPDCYFTSVIPGILWKDLPMLKAQNVDPELLGQVVTLAEEIWPGPANAKNDWAGRIATPTAP